MTRISASRPSLSRLRTALDEGDATVAFHGHARNGPYRDKTSGGVLVFNVSVTVLEQEGIGVPCFVVEV